MPSAAHLPDEDFINKSLLASLDADAEPHDAPDSDDRFFQPNNAPALYDYPKFPHSNPNYRASFTAYPNTTRARHHAAAAHPSAHNPAPFFSPPDSYPNPYPVYDYPYKQQAYPPSNVQLSSQTPYGPHVPAIALASSASQQPVSQSGLALNMPSLPNAPNSTSSGEEISTIFVVGFPEDMQEREFQNMFTFSSGFEAATLKIPNKEYSAYGSIVGGPPGVTLPNGLGLGLGRSFPYVNPNDPYSLVTVNPGGGVIDSAQSSLRDPSQQQQQQVADELSANTHYLGAGPGPGSAAGLGLAGLALSNAANGNSNTLNPNIPPRKQIIGFAKFRSREEALAARDILQGRRVDIEKGAVLKAEMAKKNLHTKRGVGPVPVGPGTGTGAGLQSGQQQGQQVGQSQSQQQQHMNGLSLAGLDAYNTEPVGSGVFATSSSTTNSNNNRDSLPALARLGWRDSVPISNSTSVLQQQQQHTQSQSLSQQHDSHQANGASLMTSPVLSGPMSSSSGEEERKRDSLLSVHLGGMSLGSSPNMLHASVSSVNGQRGPRERAEEEELRERERERGERERGERDRDMWRRKEKEREKEINLMRLRATNPPAFDAFHGVSSSGSAGTGAAVNGSVNGTSTSTGASGMSRQSSTASTSSGSLGGGAGVAGVWANTPNTNATAAATESVATSSPMLGSASSESYDHHLHQQHMHMREHEQQEESEEERDREHEQQLIAERSQEQEQNQHQVHERDEPAAVLGPWDRVHGATSYAAVVGRHGNGNGNSNGTTNANNHSASHHSANSNGAGLGSVLPPGNVNAKVMSSSESERSTSPVGSLYQPSSVDGLYQHQQQQFQQQQQQYQQQQQQWYQPQYMHLHEQQQAALHQQQQQQQQQILFEQQQNVYQSSYNQQHQQYRSSSQSESSETGSVVGAETGATSPRDSTGAANNAIGYVGARLGFGVGLGQQKSSAPLSSSSSVPPTPGAGAVVPRPMIPAAGVSGESAAGNTHVSPSTSAGASTGETSPQLPSPASASGSGSGSAVGSGGGSVVGSGSVSGMSVGIGGGMNGAVGGVRGTVDQNPPINTLYVGNLPTSPLPLGYSSDFLEDTLRTLFSACAGFRKLCFRQKANGPMCFIEFIDVQSATDALKLLSGNTLGGTVKNGIRLSYSKNPLGVRTPTSAGANTGGPTLQQQQQLMQTLSNHNSSSHHQPQHHQQFQSYQQQQMGPPPSSATSSSSGGGHDGNSFQTRISSDDSFGMGVGQSQTQHRLPTSILRRDSTMSPTTMASLAQAQQAQQHSYITSVNSTGGGSHVNGNANGNTNGGSFFSSPPPRFYSTSSGPGLGFTGGSGGISSTPLTGASSAFVPRSATNGGSLIGMFNNSNSLNGSGSFGGYGMSSTNSTSSSQQQQQQQQPQQHQQGSFSPFGMSFSHNQHSLHEMFGGPPLLSQNLNMNMNQHPQLQPLSIPGGVGDQLHLVQQVQGLVDD